MISHTWGIYELGVGEIKELKADPRGMENAKVLDKMGKKLERL